MKRSRLTQRELRELHRQSRAASRQPSAHEDAHGPAAVDVGAVAMVNDIVSNAAARRLRQQPEAVHRLESGIHAVLEGRDFVAGLFALLGAVVSGLKAPPIPADLRKHLVTHAITLIWVSANSDSTDGIVGARRAPGASAEAEKGAGAAAPQGKLIH